MTSILIVGVGGQGTLLASKVIGRLALNRGLDVKVSEVHGMSQRGGSVVTYVRYGERVRSPLVEPGGADILIACELLEAARWLPYLKPGGAVAASGQRIMPMPVITGAAEYPGEAAGAVRAACSGAAFIDALAIAEECGERRAANIATLGAASRYMQFAEEEWREAIKAVTPPRALEANLCAFMRGAGAGADAGADAGAGAGADAGGAPQRGAGADGAL